MYVFAMLGATVALYFIIAAVKQPRLSVIIAAVLWALYVVYEILINSEVLCGRNCNIRVDLILIWPVLIASSLIASKHTGHDKTFGRIAVVIGLLLLVLLLAPVIYIAISGFPATP